MTGKAGLTPCERSRHTHFKYARSNGEIPLPMIVAVSRGSGDLPPVAVNGIAKALGLRREELFTSERCEISGPCLHVALVAMLIRHSVQQPQIFEPEAVAESISLIIDDTLAALKKAKKCRPSEADLLSRLKADIGETTRYDCLDKGWMRLWQGIVAWQEK